MPKNELLVLFGGVKQKITRARMENADVCGHVDVLTDGVLHGWALAPRSPHVPVFVQCVVGEKALDPVLAIGERPDVAAAQYQTAVCGFSIDIKPLVDSLAAESKRWPITIDVLAGYDTLKKIGSWTPCRWMADFGVYEEDVDRAKIRQLGVASAQILTRANREFHVRQKEFPFLEEADAFEDYQRHALSAAVAKVVAPTSFPETLRMSQGKKLVLSNYVDQQRYRFNLSRSFRIELADSEVDSYLRWYLTTYVPHHRGWRRAPLSAQEIEYLNGSSPLPFATLAMYLFMPEAFRQAARGTEEFRIELAYWWAVEQAPSAFVEDCLVPDWCINLLRKSRKELHATQFPLTHFMERYFARHQELHFLDLTRAAHRLLYYFYLIMLAAERPDLLRLLPPEILAQLIDAGDGSIKGFSGLAHKIFEILELGAFAFAPKLLLQMISARMFDIKKMKFCTLSTEGHRLLSAAWPAPRSQKKIDVQLIGPLEKASGLGQAVRLSAAMIEKTGLKIGAFDFGLDNPAPEGFSSKVKTDKLQKSRINIVHLNGESVQLAFSYLPDVFDGSYNIGYFYWELDTPAACHHLSIELLDEIWVSSEYCRETYAKVTDKPVINVGMCVESVAVSKNDARNYARKKLRCSDDEFVFLAAFDSFSFVQRKNPIGVIRAFRAAFSENERVRLVLKTQNRSRVQDPQQTRIWEAVDDEIAKDERVALLDETLTYKDLRRLKSGVDCYISLHRSEGWGFGMIEAMAMGIPVIATAYSGNMDFCTPETCWLVDYDLVCLYPDDYIFVVPGQKWAEPKLDSAAAQMRAVAFDVEERERRARFASDFVNSNFSEAAISQRYGARLKEILARLD